MIDSSTRIVSELMDKYDGKISVSSSMHADHHRTVLSLFNSATTSPNGTVRQTFLGSREHASAIPAF
jgi:hypothetical protein